MADQKDILERVSELPDDLRKALFAHSTTDAIQGIGKNAGLPIDKVGELADETGRVMLGITPPSDYVKNLVSRLSVNQEKAKAIAEEINQKVFQPVRESLKKIHGITSETPTSPPPLLRKEGTPVSKSPPLQGGVGEVKKPLPKREPARNATQSVAGGDIVSLPPIFVKKMPEPIIPKPDIIPPPKEPLPQNSLAAKNALEKELSAQPPKPPAYQGRDPYKEPIE